MKRLTATMFGLVGFALALLVTVVLTTAKPAAAAPAYCGHGYKTYIRNLPAGPTVFRIVYRWGSTATYHLHAYRIFRLRVGYTNKWVYVRSLERVCPNRHPV